MYKPWRWKVNGTKLIATPLFDYVTTLIRGHQLFLLNACAWFFSWLLPMLLCLWTRIASIMTGDGVFNLYFARQNAPTAKCRELEKFRSGQLESLPLLRCWISSCGLRRVLCWYVLLWAIHGFYTNVSIELPSVSFRSGGTLPRLTILILKIQISGLDGCSGLFAWAETCIRCRSHLGLFSLSSLGSGY